MVFTDAIESGSPAGPVSAARTSILTGVLSHVAALTLTATGGFACMTDTLRETTLLRG